MKKLATFALLFFLVLGGFYGTASSQDMATLWISPQLECVTVGSEILVQVKITECPFAYGIGAQILFDTQYLEINPDKVVEGEFFRQDGATTYFASKVTTDPQNPKVGKLIFGITRFNDQNDSYGPIAGEGLVLYFSAKVKVVGECALGFKEVNLINLQTKQGETSLEKVPVKLEESKINICAKDNIAPNVTITKSPPLETNQVIGQFCYQATDDSTPQDKIQYSVRLEDPIRGGEWTPWMDKTCYSYTFGAQGKNTFCVRARDEFGNVSQPACVTINYDSTPPILELAPIPPEVEEITYNLCGKTEKPETGISLLVQGARVPINNDGTFCVQLRLVEGPNTVHVAAIDKAGNIVQETHSVSLIKKTTIVMNEGQRQGTINGSVVIIDPPPTNIKGRVLVPLRFITEAFGMNPTYESTEKRVDIIWTVKEGGTPIQHHLRLWINKKNYTLDGKTMFLDVPPQIVSGRTMVPIRFIAESFGATIDYDSANRRVTIVYVKR